MKKSRHALVLAFLLPHLCPGASALDRGAIQGMIDRAIRAGGGEVVIPRGVHIIERELVIKDARRLRIVGEDRRESVLRLPPLSFALTAAAAAAGDARIAVGRARNIVPGMRLHIQAPGEIEPFTGRPRPYVQAVAKAVGDGGIQLERPLAFPVPAGALIRDDEAPNIFRIRGASGGIAIEDLTLDGGRVREDPPVRGHVQLCAILAQGPYSYERGPTGPRVKGVSVGRCVIRNCHGRGVALYSVEGGRIEDCALSDLMDEAIDLDHFVVGIVARRNRIERAPVGVELNDATGCEVVSNEILECGIGIHLWRWCKLPGLNEGNRLEGNRIDRSAGNGIQIGEGAGANIVRRNEITRSGRNGISLASAGQTLSENRISDSAKQDIADGARPVP